LITGVAGISDEAQHLVSAKVGDFVEGAAEHHADVAGELLGFSYSIGTK